MHVVSADTRRTSTTPNASMTTLASPTQGGATQSLWLVEMPAGATGPVHAFEDDVVWSLTRGSAELRVAGEEVRLRDGDTVVLPGGVMRQFRAGDEGFSAIATCAGPGRVTREDGTDVGTPDWVA